jgi:CBS domain containing-hemolysin-like protein
MVDMGIDWEVVAPWLIAAVALVVLSGFFSGSEVALFGLRRMEREQLARSGRSIDSVVLGLLSQPRRLVTSVLVGNEAVTMTIAAIAVALFEMWWPGATPAALIAIAVAVAAPVVLLLGAVVPRTLAIKAPIVWARAAARPMEAFAILVTPVRWVVQLLADGIARVFGGSGRPRASGDLSEEEFRKLVDAGSAQGQVDARERRLIHKVFEFGDKNVGQIMTPRDKAFALAYDLPMARLAKEVAARGFSRVPIYQRSLDNIRGILNAKDLVLATAGQAPARTLSELLHEPLFVPRTTPLARLFRTFKQKKVHMALVVSEYGGLLGVVTMEDLLEQLFGEIRDERDKLQNAGEGSAGAGGLRGRGGRTPPPGSIPAVTAADVAAAAVEIASQPAQDGGGGDVEAVDDSADDDVVMRSSGVLSTVGSVADAANVSTLVAEATAEAAATEPSGDDLAPQEITKPFDLDDLAATDEVGRAEGEREVVREAERVAERTGERAVVEPRPKSRAKSKTKDGSRR